MRRPPAPPLAILAANWGQGPNLWPRFNDQHGRTADKAQTVPGLSGVTGVVRVRGPIVSIKEKLIARGDPDAAGPLPDPHRPG